MSYASVCEVLCENVNGTRIRWYVFRQDYRNVRTVYVVYVADRRYFDLVGFNFGYDRSLEVIVIYRPVFALFCRDGRFLQVECLLCFDRMRAIGVGSAARPAYTRLRIIMFDDDSCRVLYPDVVNVYINVRRGFTLVAAQDINLEDCNVTLLNGDLEDNVASVVTRCVEFALLSYPNDAGEIIQSLTNVGDQTSVYSAIRAAFYVPTYADRYTSNAANPAFNSVVRTDVLSRVNARRSMTLLCTYDVDMYRRITGLRFMRNESNRLRYVRNYLRTFNEDTLLNGRDLTNNCLHDCATVLFVFLCGYLRLLVCECCYLGNLSDLVRILGVIYDNGLNLRYCRGFTGSLEVILSRRLDV